ncbi:MAG: serine hydrolase, partial [Thermodesulfobacteriota bacterium]|nr:serine hydrolase [Thermodesulfobacteriota bacterium]
MQSILTSCTTSCTAWRNKTPDDRQSAHPYIGLIAWSVIVVFLMIIGLTQPVQSWADPSIRAPQPVPSKQLQIKLDRIVGRHLKKGRSVLASDQVHIAVIDLGHQNKPFIALHNGLKRIYPSSVIKIIYMGYIYHLADAGELVITPSVYRKLYQMIHPSSNKATAWIVDLWSSTTSNGPMTAHDYKKFAFKRNACNRWLRSLGIKDIHACQKTWASPIPPGEEQFLRNGRSSGHYTNRNYMTAKATARYLQLIAQDVLVNAKSSEAMRRLMIRDVKKEFADELMTNISQIVNPKKIDYVISNHTEMDHSGGL